VSLSPVERELAILASAAGEEDRYLEALARLADRGGYSIGLPIVMLVGGFEVRGSLGAEEAFASEIERILDVGLAEVADQDPEHEELASSLRRIFVTAGFFQRLVERRRARQRDTSTALREAGGETPPPFRELVSRLPDEAAREYIEGRYLRRLTVRDAWVRAPDGAVNTVALMRVALRDVSAWWLVGSEGTRDA